MVDHEQKFVQIALFSRGISSVLKGKILANIFTFFLTTHIFLLISVLGLTIRIISMTHLLYISSRRISLDLVNIRQVQKNMRVE